MIIVIKRFTFVMVLVIALLGVGMNIAQAQEAPLPVPSPAVAVPAGPQNPATVPTAQPTPNPFPGLVQVPTGTVQFGQDPAAQLTPEEQKQCSVWDIICRWFVGWEKKQQKKAHEQIGKWWDQAQPVISTPDITSSVRVQQLWSLCREMAWTSLVVIIAIGGMMLYGKEATVGEVLKRTLIAALLTTSSLWITREMITTSNILTNAFLKVDPEVFKMTAERILIVQALGPIITKVISDLALLLSILNIARIILLTLLTIASPILAMAYAIPKFAGFTQLWLKGNTILLTASVIQGFLILFATVALFSGVGSPFDGVPGDSVLIDTIVLGVVMVMIFAVPWIAIKKAAQSARFSPTRSYRAAQVTQHVTRRAVVRGRRIITRL